jgi:hypothetical protein
LTVPGPTTCGGQIVDAYLQHSTGSIGKHLFGWLTLKQRSPAFQRIGKLLIWHPVKGLWQDAPILAWRSGHVGHATPFTFFSYQPALT